MKPQLYLAVILNLFRNLSYCIGLVWTMKRKCNTQKFIIFTLQLSKMIKTGFVYILSNKSRTTLYIGVTSNLMKRLTEHRAGLGGVFTKKYNVHELLYFEEVQGMLYAIAREKQLKNWHRDWKWNLIKERNPDLLDLAADWFHDKDASY